MNLELLSPAKDLECGIAAIDNGADAVYIGAQSFSARAAAGNSSEDIERLVAYAHQYGAKVYVTLNTILYEDELDDVRQLVTLLYNIGVDALIVQDLALLKIAHEMPCPPLHASTQMDVRSVEKVKWLRSLGFRRVVLARELSVQQIADIHHLVPDVELEVFVHGALCVSYSGQCYASQYCFQRSANRGNCAQFCRLKFNLEDEVGNVVVRDKYLLSLKDMNRLSYLGELVAAGAVSFKIEGRLKDADYVKNVTAAYSQALDAVVATSEGALRRASFGHCEYAFVPNVAKTFNRGFTSYFLDVKHEDVGCMDSPKSRGEFVGKIKDVRRNSFTVSGIAKFANGDGLCFLNKHNVLVGFRINRVEGNLLFPHRMPEDICHGVQLYRNNDEQFRKILSSSTTRRRLACEMLFEEILDGFRLTMIDEMQRSASALLVIEKEKARSSQMENIRQQLSKLGNTIFDCQRVRVQMSEEWFIPSSMLSDLRRRVCEKIAKVQQVHHPMIAKIEMPDEESVVPFGDVSWRNNVANSIARTYYPTDVECAFELKQPSGEKLIMQSRYCVLYALGKCRRQQQEVSMLKDPLFLVLPDKRHFRLEFDCKNCQMNVYAE